MTRFELAMDVKARLGESPVWLQDAGALLFVDITGRRLHRFDPATGRCWSATVEEDIGCVAPMAGGGFVAAMRSGVYRLDAEGKTVAKLADNPEDQAASRFNDGRIDPAGRLIVGTVDEKKTGAAHLYRLDANGLAVLESGLLTSNGLAFSPDGGRLYHSDTPRFVVYCYDYDVASGAVANRRVFVQIEPTATDRGRPDGGAVDVEGCYWTALYDGARVQRYDPDGRLMAEYSVPARKPTMPAFGGPDRKTLFVTTAADGADEKPGALWAARVDVAGAASPPFQH